MAIHMVSPKAQPQRSGGRTKLSAGSVRNSNMHNVPGTKLVKRLIKQAVAEHSPYKDTLARMQLFVDVR
jgi:hypothetical protein